MTARTSYSRPAASPLVGYACPEGPLTKCIALSIWIKIFLYFNREYRVYFENVHPEAVDVSILERLAQCCPDELSALPGVGPKTRVKLSLLLEHYRAGQIVRLEPAT